MTRLLRKLLFLGAVAGAFYWLREKMMPPPQPRLASPPPFRTTEPAPSVQTPSQSSTKTRDDLTRVKGIGPVYQKRLAEDDITTFADLADGDAVAIAAGIDMSVQQVEDWQEQARRLM